VLTALGAHAAGFATAWRCLGFLVCRGYSNPIISTGHINVDIGAGASANLDRINSGSWYHCSPIGIYH